MPKIIISKNGVMPKQDPQVCPSCGARMIRLMDAGRLSFYCYDCKKQIKIGGK